MAITRQERAKKEPKAPRPARRADPGRTREAGQAKGATDVAVAAALPAEMTPADTMMLSQEDDVLVSQLLELASAAFTPGLRPEAEGKIDVEALRRAYNAREVQREPAHNQGQPGDGLHLSHPNIPRPWTDRHRWIHTGYANDYGEEISIVPDSFTWHRPTNTYNNSHLPQPPPRMKARLQTKSDQIYGFPPLIGQRNLPRGEEGAFVNENVELEVAKIKAREAALRRGISIDRSMSLDDVERCIRERDGTYSNDKCEQAKFEDRRSAPKKMSSARIDLCEGTGLSQKRAIDEFLRDTISSGIPNRVISVEASARKKRRAELDARVKEFGFTNLYHNPFEHENLEEPPPAQPSPPPPEAQNGKHPHQQQMEEIASSFDRPGRLPKRAAAIAAAKLTRELCFNGASRTRRRPTRQRSHLRSGSKGVDEKHPVESGGGCGEDTVDDNATAAKKAEPVLEQ